MRKQRYPVADPRFGDRDHFKPEELDDEPKYRPPFRTNSIAIDAFVACDDPIMYLQEVAAMVS